MEDFERLIKELEKITKDAYDQADYVAKGDNAKRSELYLKIKAAYHKGMD